MQITDDSFERVSTAFAEFQKRRVLLGGKGDEAENLAREIESFLAENNAFDPDDLDTADMLAEMLRVPGLLFVAGQNGPFFYESDGDKAPAAIFVNCNDLFAWACADAEPLPMSEINNLYAMEREHRPHGASIWACLRRGMRPQGPVEKKMREAGAWTDEMEALPLREPGR